MAANFSNFCKEINFELKLKAPRDVRHSGAPEKTGETN